jgi:hypothetical protein
VLPTSPLAPVVSLDDHRNARTEPDFLNNGSSDELSLEGRVDVLEEQVAALRATLAVTLDALQMLGDHVIARLGVPDNT